jgi:hypothetical protein
MKRLKPFICSRVIVGGMESSWRFTRTSTKARAATSGTDGEPSREMGFRAGREGRGFLVTDMDPLNLLRFTNGVGDAVERVAGYAVDLADTGR